MAEIDIKAIIDEYARDKRTKISKLKKAIDDELKRLLKETINNEGKS